jgi:hypothetical protein
MSSADLMDIIRTRLPLDMEALPLSIENGDNQWKAGIVATLHGLVNYISWAPEDARGAATGFDAVHNAFHMALISACGSPRMLAFLDVLYDQGVRCRHLVLKNRKPREHLQRIQRIDEYRILADLSIKGSVAAWNPARPGLRQEQAERGWQRSEISRTRSRGANLQRRSSCGRCVGTYNSQSAIATLSACLRIAGSALITRPYFAGSRLTLPGSRRVSDHIYVRRTAQGAWMRHIFG